MLILKVGLSNRCIFCVAGHVLRDGKEVLYSSGYCKGHVLRDGGCGELEMLRDDALSLQSTANPLFLFKSCSERAGKRQEE
jgi:hypothetical protein